MTIVISSSSPGRAGSGLKGRLTHLNAFIEDEIAKSGFQSSFTTLHVTLYYPSIFALAKNRDKTIADDIYYQSLPQVKFNRKNKRVEISIPAAEFSDHFSKSELAQSSNAIESDVSLAHLLISKIILATTAINTRLAKTDVFNADTFINSLTTIKNKMTSESLPAIANVQYIISGAKQLSTAVTRRENRSTGLSTVTTPIKNIRLFFSYRLPLHLIYLNRWADLVLRLLAEQRFQCRQHAHLYISVADTEEQALKEAIASEDWYTYGVAILPETTLVNADPSSQQQLVLNAIRDGLLDIAVLDKLDTDLICDVIDKARQLGILSEQPFKTKENNKVSFSILTRTIEGGAEEEIFFQLIDKQTAKKVKWKFGTHSIALIQQWFGTITVTNKKVTIKPRPYTALLLKGKPAPIEIDVVEQLIQ